MLEVRFLHHHSLLPRSAVLRHQSSTLHSQPITLMYRFVVYPSPSSIVQISYLFIVVVGVLSTLPPHILLHPVPPIPLLCSSTISLGIMPYHAIPLMSFPRPSFTFLHLHPTSSTPLALQPMPASTLDHHLHSQLTTISGRTISSQSTSVSGFNALELAFSCNSLSPTRLYTIVVRGRAYLCAHTGHCRRRVCVLLELGHLNVGGDRRR
ncbi:hypothetical protein BDN70DRAFT_701308 [Pholiota conissans]|uniref:Uncharacterized protein n=1 Tax=Pholiota conissans TaxID=109636 RepID=A0A9P6D0C4_9AGAR|nr:hypothetical protein BDN70DRAFT_701308 [Pholiota conissans]